MGLSPEKGSKPQPIVGVSATELRQGPVVDRSCESLAADPDKFSSERDGAQIHLNRAGWSELSQLAQDLNVPFRDLMGEALNDVLIKHQRPPVVEAKPPGHELASDFTVMIGASLVPLAWPLLVSAWCWQQAMTLPLLAMGGGKGYRQLR